MEMLARIGRLGVNFGRAVAKFLGFLASAVYNIFAPPFYPSVLLRQILEIGFYSLPVVALTSFFAGMVLAVQSYSGFSQFSAGAAVASVVSIAITRELGPVLAGLMVAGRIGATFAASIGAMRVSEQLEALTTLSTDPMKYIVAPRVLAGILALPFLVFIANIIGIFGGFVVAVNTLGFSPYGFIRNIYASVSLYDLWIGIVKGACFGGLIASVGCYFGYHARGGADGVGRATTNTVVVSAITILVFNYLITAWFFEGV